MTPDQITQANAELRSKPALEVVKWAIAQANGRAIVSTNFRPYEAVILHLVTQMQLRLVHDPPAPRTPRIVWTAMERTDDV